MATSPYVLAVCGKAAILQPCEVAVSESCRYNLVVLPVKSW